MSSGPPPQRLINNNQSFFQPCIDGITQYRNTNPLSTRSYIFTLLLCLIITFFIDAGFIFIVCPYNIFKLYELYRIFFNIFFDVSILNGLIGILFFYQSHWKIEIRRGSIFTLLFPYIISILINIIIILFMLAFNSTYGVSDMYGKQYNSILKYMSLCSCGVFATSFALMSYETFLTDEVTRKLCCFPCEIPVMQLPLLMCAIFSLLGGISLDMWIGLGLGGYIETRLMQDNLIYTFIRNAEKGGCCSIFMWMQSQPLFIPFDRALANTGIEILNIPDTSNSSQTTHAQTTAPRRPAGPGHSLQSSNESSWNIPAFNIFSNNSESTNSSDTLTSSKHKGHALADRFEKSKNEIHPPTMKSATGEAYFTPLPPDYYDNKETKNDSAVFEIGDPEHIDSTDTPSNPYEYRPVTHNNNDDDDDEENQNNGKNNKK